MEGWITVPVQSQAFFLLSEKVHPLDVGTSASQSKLRLPLKKHFSIFFDDFLRYFARVSSNCPNFTHEFNYRKKSFIWPFLYENGPGVQAEGRPRELRATDASSGLWRGGRQIGRTANRKDGKCVSRVLGLPLTASTAPLVLTHTLDLWVTGPIETEHRLFWTKNKVESKAHISSSLLSLR